MEGSLEELKNSWTHCKELMKTHASKELVIAFLEDFKVQFTKFYQQILSKRTKYQQLAVSLVDKAFMFWKKEGEISLLISYVQNNWDAKPYIMKRIELIDKIVMNVFTQYTTKKIIYS